jgi:hypothetical protein
MSGEHCQKAKAHMTYCIQFDFPGAPVVFAGLVDGNAMGFAPTLKTATLYDDADEAHRFLTNGYGSEINKWGRVMTVAVGVAVSR